MKGTARRLWLVMTVVALSTAWAAGEDEDRAVARISLAEGDVSVRLGDGGEWVAAAANAPMVVEDALATGARARAEIQLDWANLARLGGDTEVRLAELENERYILQLARGLLTYRVLRDSSADVEISTPVVSVRPAAVGAYRIFVRDDGVVEITVRSGAAVIYTPTGSERLRAGQTMIARGTASYPEFKIAAAVAPDAWDRWNEERDRVFERSQAYQYVDRSIYGAEDLDGYGSWVYVDPYGWVWAPAVDAGWAPYYNGRWVWMDWYGWNWVSYDPWGWAPYHYGRWFFHANRWCWWPGAFGVRHAWSPGLVAFVGWGGWNGVSVGVGFGQIGWIPLAPYEPYHPWYGRGYYGGYRGGVTHPVQVTVAVDVGATYRNARVVNGITGVDAGMFGRGGGVRHLRIDPANLRRADLVRGPLPMVPDRESLRLTDRPAPPPRVREAASGTFVSRRTPRPVERIPFEVQRRTMERTAGRAGAEPPRPAAGRTVTPEPGRGVEIRPATPEPGQGTGVRPPAAAQPGSWRRIGEPRMSDPGERPTAPPARERERATPQIRIPPPGDRNAERISPARPPEPRRAEETPRPAPPPSAERAPATPLRIAPPIVRERVAPPRVERPQAAPRPEPRREAAPEAPRNAPSGGGESRRAGSGPRNR